MADAVIGRGYLQVVPKMDKGALDSELDKAGKSGSSKFSKSFEGGMSAKTVAIGNIMSSALIKGVEMASRAATEVFTQAFSNFAEFEQLSGGVQKIFNDMDTSRVFADANNAWRDLNMSANEYMATINDVGAMFSATMGDEAAYDTARRGMKAISDYSTGTGKNLDVLSQKFAMITRSTSSYQSIADQFSGILPATSKSFLEQAQAAGYLSDSYKSLTEVPIDEYQSALVSMLEDGTKALGLQGNTAHETARTVSGALAGMNAAWQNWLTGLADTDADMSQLTKDLIESVANAVDNAVPRIQQILATIGPAAADAIGGVIGNISPEWGAIFDRVADGVGKVADSFAGVVEHAEASGALDDIATAITNIGDAISSADFTEFFEMISNCINALTDFYEQLKEIEAEVIASNGGEPLEITNPETWHLGSEAAGSFKSDLESLGTTTSEYSKLSDATMRKVAQAYRNNGGDMEAALASVGLAVDEYSGKIVDLNNLELYSKYATVELQDDQLVDAQGNVYTWNGTDLVDKDGNVVVDRLQLIDAQGKVVTWNGTGFDSKSASVKVNTTQIDDAKSSWNLWEPVTKYAEVIVRKITESVGDAAGGFYQLHAGGGFVTNGVTSLGRDRFGIEHIAGEAGHEWVQRHADGTTSIVPIENRKYLEPYASTIASMIGAGDSELVIRWLALNLGPIIANYAPTISRRDFDRMARGAIA